MSRSGPLRRPILLIVVGASLLAGACVAEGPLASFTTVGGSGSVASLPSASAATPGQAADGSPGGEATLVPTASAVAHAGVTGHLTAGPTCPVETVPPNSACAPRPVAGATVIATDAAGHEVARAASTAEGYYVLDVAPGRYTLTPRPVSDR
jgi:hypothetical protein